MSSSSCCTRTHFQTATSALNLTHTIMHLQVRVTHAGELLKHASCLFRSSPSVSFSSACSVRGASPTLPNLAQLILGSGQRLKCDEVITYSHTVGVHLQNTQRVSKEEEKSHEQLYTLPHTVHHNPLTTHIQK